MNGTNHWKWYCTAIHLGSSTENVHTNRNFHKPSGHRNSASNMALQQGFTLTTNGYITWYWYSFWQWLIVVDNGTTGCNRGPQKSRLQPIHRIGATPQPTSNFLISACCCSTTWSRAPRGNWQRATIFTKQSPNQDGETTYTVLNRMMSKDWCLPGFQWITYLLSSMVDSDQWFDCRKT